MAAGTVTFSWRTSPGETYTLILDGRVVPACSRLDRGECTTRVTPGDHRWTVRAALTSDPDGTSVPGAVRSFTLEHPNRPPTPPVLLHPAAGELLQAGHPAFRWTPSTDPDRDPVTYVVRVERLDNGLTRDFPCDWTRTGTSCGVDLLGGRYAWSVTASDGRGGDSQSARVEFEVNRPPTPSVPLLHPDLEQLRRLPTLFLAGWTSATDPDGDRVEYRVIAKDTSDGTERITCSATDAAYRRADEFGLYICDPARLRAGRTYEILIETRDDRGGITRGPTLTIDTLPPILFLHGWTGDATTWASAAAQFEEYGFEVLRVNRALISYTPDDTNDRTIQEFAENQVRQRWRSALVSAGYSPNDRVVIVAHSMGGLVARHLIENEGMAPFVDTLVMVGTPNQGVEDWGICEISSRNWRESCNQMTNERDFLSRVLPPKSSPSESVKYHTIAGRWRFQWDGVVTTTRAQLPSTPHLTIEGPCHSFAYPLNCKQDALPEHHEVLRAAHDAIQATR